MLQHEQASVSDIHKHLTILGDVATTSDDSLDGQGVFIASFI